MHCVDLGESFPTSIYLQNFVSIQPLERALQSLPHGAALSLSRAHTLAKVGGGPKTAIEAYNKAVGSYETRVLPQGRKIEELSGGETPNRLPESLGPIETQARQVAGDSPPDPGHPD